MQQDTLALGFQSLLAGNRLGSQMSLVGLLSVRIAIVLALTPVLYAMPIPVRIRALLVVVLALALSANFLPSRMAAPVEPGTDFGPSTNGPAE